MTRSVLIHQTIFQKKKKKSKLSPYKQQSVMTGILVDGPVPMSQPRKYHLCTVWLSSVQSLLEQIYVVIFISDVYQKETKQYVKVYSQTDDRQQVILILTCSFNQVS